MCENNNHAGLFYEYAQSVEILDIFDAFTFSFLERQNYLEFYQISHIPRTDRKFWTPL